MKKVFTALLIATIFCTGSLTKLSAQKFKYEIPGLDTLEHQFIVAGGASTVLGNGEFEIINNNSLVSFWIAFHENGNHSPVLDRLRSTQFTTDVSAFYGISASSRIDVGLQVSYVRSRIDNSAGSSFFKVFESTPTIEDEINAPFNGSVTLDQSIGAIARAGVRFRFRPIIQRPELVVNGGYAFSTVSDRSKQIQLNADRDIFDLGATYYHAISRQVYYFFGTSIRAFLPSIETNESLYNSNFNFFLIQRTNNNKFTFYPGLSYSLNFKPSEFDSHAVIKTADFLFAIGGIQYEFNTDFNAFITGGMPLITNVVHPQQEIVRQSYSLLAVGFRAGF